MGPKSLHFFFVFSSNMAGAAVKILDGLGDNPLNDNQAGDFLTWVGDLAGDSFDDNDEAFKDVSVDSQSTEVQKIDRSIAEKCVRDDWKRPTQRFIMVIGLRVVQFGLQSYSCLTKSDDTRSGSPIC